MPKEDKDLAQKQEAGQLATYDFGADADVGFENTTQDDYSIPFIGVLQALSPQVQGKSKVPGAEPGYLFNTVTGEVIDPEVGIHFVPVHREQVYVEWVPRKSGGGFVGRHEMSSDIVAESKALPRGDRGQILTRAGNELIQTAYLYGMLVHEDQTVEPCVISFTSTKLKKYRHWMTKVNQFQVSTPNGRQTPPIFAHQIRISSVSESNKHGDFFNFKITPLNGDLGNSLLDPRSDLYQAAKKLASSFRSGEVNVNYDAGDAVGSGGDDGGDEVPFD